MTGSNAVGRSLPGVAHHGLWQVRMVHDPANTGISGFNLKSAGLAGFASTERIRVGMAPGQVGFDGPGMAKLPPRSWREEFRRDAQA